MAYNYDELYQNTPDALGAPTALIVDFFREHITGAQRVLDVGCGQGRDALFIAAKGHEVVGVDMSPHGIADLNKAAAAGGLNIQGVVADITTYEPNGMFDVILIDRTLHMLDKDPRHKVLATLLEHLSSDGWLLIADEASNMEGFKTVIAEGEPTWEIAYEKGGYLFMRQVSNKGTS